MPGDTRNKRTRLQRKQDRTKIVDMYIKGYYQSQIAEEIGVCQQEISAELKMIQKKWQELTTMALDEYKAKDLVVLILHFLEKVLDSHTCKGKIKS